MELCYEEQMGKLFDGRSGVLLINVYAGGVLVHTCYPCR